MKIHSIVVGVILVVVEEHQQLVVEEISDHFLRTLDDPLSALLIVANTG